MKKWIIVVVSLFSLNLAQAKKAEFLKTVPEEIAIFGGGCFWGVQDIIRKLPGVLKTDVGYSGGGLLDPAYADVHKGLTGHAEVVRVYFSPQKISYEKLLDYFFRLHDPTTLNRQGNDIGTQYRSVIFYQNDEQRKVASAKKEAVEQGKKWKKPVITEIVAAKPFYKAEDYHQDYLVKNPGGYTCHFLRD